MTTPCTETYKEDKVDFPILVACTWRPECCDVQTYYYCKVLVHGLWESRDVMGYVDSLAETTEENLPMACKAHPVVLQGPPILSMPPQSGQKLHGGEVRSLCSSLDMTICSFSPGVGHSCT